MGLVDHCQGGDFTPHGTVIQPKLVGDILLQFLAIPHLDSAIIGASKEEHIVLRDAQVGNCGPVLGKVRHQKPFRAPRGQRRHLL